MSTPEQFDYDLFPTSFVNMSRSKWANTEPLSGEESCHLEPRKKTKETRN